MAMVGTAPRVDRHGGDESDDGGDDGRLTRLHGGSSPRRHRLRPGTPNNWGASGAGFGIHWPDLDEDLSTEGLLRGAAAAPEPVLAKAG